MKVTIKPGTARGEITAPPSKSAAHRALICGALSEGSTVHGVSDSDDMRATLSCLDALGAKVSRGGDSVRIGGLDPLNIGDCTLYCGESGSTLRFLLPLCLISGAKISLRGTEKLISRPLDVYEKLCRERGFLYEAGKDCVTVSGRLAPGVYDVSMSKSSQFTTGLLFALSTLDGESRIDVAGKAESTSYVDLTLSVMRDFGARVSKIEGGYSVSGNTLYRSLSYDVEGDRSNAAFLSALNFFGGNVGVKGLSPVSVQGDRIYPELFEKIQKGERVDVSDCPDLAPILFALGAYRGSARITGTSRLRYKESDRAEAMKRELSAFGIETEVREDEVVISGELHAPHRILSSHNDHRVAMALAVLCTVTGGEIDGAEAVAKSYPDFYKDIIKLGIEVGYSGS
ncbi:MAG: 3-phosphoshikimate 1-carboxyvinyltransferase [Clostridia bacterium]|nr:3-phosphoshikimate 1-carboxyvinyltransferase [Clostridia bacterium]